jgi:hypothetical protein
MSSRPKYYTWLERFTRTNTPAYFAIKRFITLTQAITVIKLFSSSLTKMPNVFASGKPLQPSLIFASKAGAYPSGALTKPKSFIDTDTGRKAVTVIKVFHQDQYDDSKNAN